MATNRNMKMPGVWAKDALTTIPQPPVSGIAYRNDSLTEAEVNEGQKYGSIGDSAVWNQELWAATTLLKELESQGILSWSPLVDYSVSAMVMGSNDKLYSALQASGPSTAPQDPVNDSTQTYWILADLQLKADVDLDNVTAPGNVRMAHAAMPSGQYETLTVPASGGTVTAPADGYYSFSAHATAVGVYVSLINNTSKLNINSGAVDLDNNCRIFIPAAKNDVVQVNYDPNTNYRYLYFIYSNGSAA